MYYSETPESAEPHQKKPFDFAASFPPESPGDAEVFFHSGSAWRDCGISQMKNSGRKVRLAGALLPSSSLFSEPAVSRVSSEKFILSGRSGGDFLHRAAPLGGEMNELGWSIPSFLHRVGPHQWKLPSAARSPRELEAPKCNRITEQIVGQM